MSTYHSCTVCTASGKLSHNALVTTAPLPAPRHTQRSIFNQFIDLISSLPLFSSPLPAMLSSAWHSLTGRKHSRDEEKKEADEQKSYDMQPLTSTASTTVSAAPLSSSSSTLSAAPKRGGRKKSKTEQQLRPVPTSTITITPSSASTLSYVAPPLVAPNGAAVPHPEHPPPSYEASQLHQYPIASVPLEPVVFIDGHAEPSAHAEQKWPLSDHAIEEQKFPSSQLSQPVQPMPLPQPQQPNQPAVHSPLPVAVPLMADQPTPFTQRLAEGATAAFLALQSHPTYQRGHAKAVALASKHIPPEVVDFIQKPSLGKLLRHPQYLLIVYRFYASVRAPFIGLFRTILVNAAKKALWRRKMSEKEMKANADTTNAAINDGLKQAIGKDMNVQLSPEVCKQIVENIDVEQLKGIFAWFTTEPVPVAVVDAKK